MIRPRWDGDERGIGIISGAAQAPEVRALVAALDEPGWIAENPDEHLLPHLRRACEEHGSPWELGKTSLRDDGVYLIDLTWKRSDGSLRQLRADVFALVGQIAEATTHIHQRVTGEVIEYLVVTGMLAGDSPFAGHGHLLRLRISGQRISPLIRGTERPPTADGAG